MHLGRIVWYVMGVASRALQLLHCTGHTRSVCVVDNTLQSCQVPEHAARMPIHRMHCIVQSVYVLLGQLHTTQCVSATHCMFVCVLLSCATPGCT
jgi:hypothetical protein